MSSPPHSCARAARRPRAQTQSQSPRPLLLRAGRVPPACGARARVRALTAVGACIVPANSPRDHRSPASPEPAATPARPRGDHAAIPSLTAGCFLLPQQAYPSQMMRAPAPVGPVTSPNTYTLRLIGPARHRCSPAPAIPQCRERTHCAPRAPRSVRSTQRRAVSGANPPGIAPSEPRPAHAMKN
ncbi:hypothetical protein OBBRIDRAFT_797083 [Obba rivulosa]|uniref:Uncharacterized protein n=1 Tax=Obba rivulosa TaxID=1052685 RepID=A0A8E2ALR9_9APHY|nr:hypothetical protein OBBRIDRAFT_797083 [Obba rivulosa]